MEKAGRIGNRTGISEFGIIHRSHRAGHIDLFLYAVADEHHLVKLLGLRGQDDIVHIGFSDRHPYCFVTHAAEFESLARIAFQFIAAVNISHYPIGGTVDNDADAGNRARRITYHSFYHFLFLGEKHCPVQYEQNRGQ